MLSALLCASCPTNDLFGAIHAKGDKAPNLTVTVTPNPVTVTKGNIQPFTAHVFGPDGSLWPDQEVEWSVQGNKLPGTGIGSNGNLYVNPAAVVETLTVRAHAIASPAKYGDAVVTLTSEAIAITPALIQPAITRNYSVGDTSPPLEIQVKNAADTTRQGGTLTYQWYSVAAGNSEGTAISGETSPQYMPPTETIGIFYYYVVVTNTIQDGDGIAPISARSLLITITVSEPRAPDVTVAVSPSPVIVTKGTTQHFDALVTGPDGSTWSSQNVEWSIQGNQVAGTSIGANGNLIVNQNETAESLTVRARSAVNPDRYGDAFVTLTTEAVAITPAFSLSAIMKSYSVGDTSPPLEAQVKNAADIAGQGGTLAYQWYRATTAVNSGGTAISGQTTASYMPPTGMAGVFFYYVIVTNTIQGDNIIAASAVSLPVTVIVGAPDVTVTVSPAAATVSKGGSQHFTAKVKGPDGADWADQDVEWSVLNNHVAGTGIGSNGNLFVSPLAEVSTLTVRAHAKVNPAKYGDAIVTLTSAISAVTPQLHLSTTSAVYTKGSQASPITVSADNQDAITAQGGTLSYQWYSINTANINDPANPGAVTITGAAGNSLSADTSAERIIWYFVVVTNTIPDNGDGGNKTASIVSDGVKVIVNTFINAGAPVIDTQPDDKTFLNGTTPDPVISVTAHAPDNGTLSYQWYYNEVVDSRDPAHANAVKIDGEAGGSLTLTTATGTRTRWYFAVVTNTIADNGDGGNKSASIASNTAQVTVTYSWISPTAQAVNGLTPAISFSKASPRAAGENITATVSFTGTAANDGTLSVNLTSTKAGLSQAAQAVTVSAGQTPDPRTFSFTMPARNIDDFTLTLGFAELPIPYYEASWDSATKKVDKTLKYKSPSEVITTIPYFTDTLQDGKWYFVDATATAAGGIVVAENATAHLILKNGVTLTAASQIYLQAKATLNIYAQTDGVTANTGVITGTNTTFGSDGGIQDVFNINIHGGKISLTDGVISMANKGQLTVYDGDISVSNSRGGSAGITRVNNNNGSSVTVYGGTLTATTTGAGSSGIDVSILTIHGGTVTAKGGNGNINASRGGGPGIGPCFAKSPVMGTITIIGGTVNATGGNGGSQAGGGAGIGSPGGGTVGGAPGSSVATSGKITITGGTITAKGGNGFGGGAGIGSGGATTGQSPGEADSSVGTGYTNNGIVGGSGVEGATDGATVGQGGIGI
jgi:hypothetical protein